MKEFLDKLYEARERTQHGLAELKKVTVFDGSPGACHAETHDAEVKLLEEQLLMLDMLITEYLQIIAK